MKKNINSKVSKLLTNNWVITLTATLVGVFLALYLNEWIADKKLNDQKSIATKNILLEIKSNQEGLDKAVIKHIEMFGAMTFLSKNMDEDEHLIAPIDSMSRFRMKYPSLITIKDSTLLSNGLYKYNGTMNFELFLPQINLTTIAWKTLRHSGISTTYAFECLMYLESVDIVTHEVLKHNKEFMDYLTGAKDSGTKSENLINHLKLLIDYEESLLKIYESSKDKLKNCG